MRFPRTPLASALLAAVLSAPAAVRAQPAYDVRLSADYDPGLLEYVVKHNGYAYDAKTGALAGPGGRPVTREEAEGAFADEGEARLTEREREIILAEGARFVERDGHPVVLEPECDAPYTPLRMAIIRRQIRDGLMGTPSAAFNAGALDAETNAAYVRAFGYRPDGGRFLDAGGQVVTNAMLTRLTRRVNAEREPDVAALAQVNGYEPRRRGGVQFLWSAQGGWLDRAAADLFLKSYGLQHQRDPGAPFKPGKDAPDWLKTYFSQPPGSIGADGAASWEGRPLTVGGFTRLLEPLDDRKLTPAQALSVRMAIGLGYSSGADGRILGPDGKTPMSRLDAGRISAVYGLTGQQSPDLPFDARLPGAAATLNGLKAVGLTMRPDGTLTRDGRVVLTRDIVEMYGIFDLGAKTRQDPRLALALKALLKEKGFSPRVVGSKTFMCQPNSGPCITNEAMRGNMMALASGGMLFTKTGLIGEQLKRARAGQPVDPMILSRIDQIAKDQGGYLPSQLARAAKRTRVSSDELRAAFEAGAEDDARVWASANQLATGSPSRPPRPTEDLARERALAARDGSERLSEKLEQAFADMYRAQGSAVAAEQRAAFGRARMPFLSLATDAEEAAHYDSSENRVVFMITPQLAQKLAMAAGKSSAAEFRDPAKLGPAMLKDPALLAAFAREQAWNYIHEHGHALSALNGPAAVERKGLQTISSWTDEEKVAFLWETRYTHELLSQNPAANVPAGEVARYSRVLGGYSLWSLDIVREHLEVMPGRFASLPEARRIQAGWIERAKTYVATGKFPGAAKLLESLRTGDASLAEINAAYDKYFDQKARPQLTRMAIEGDLNMAARYAAPGPQHDRGIALSFRAVAPVSLANAITSKEVTPAQASALQARMPSGRDLRNDALAYARTWRQGLSTTLTPAVASQAAQSLEAIDAYFRHLEKSPAALAQSGLSAADVRSVRGELKTQIDAAWSDHRTLSKKEKPTK